jgi:hypothetical protein
MKTERVFQVAAAFSFLSEWSRLIEASTSRTSVSPAFGAAPAAHAVALAVALAVFTPARCAVSMRSSSSRHVVVNDATGPCSAC